MSIANQFLFALQAYQEIQAELHPQAQTLPASPQASKAQPAFASPAALPGGSLLLGLAEDGLPVLLDLYDPLPGPLLVAGDRGSGKTAFLQSLSRASNLQDPGEISFGVLTPFPEEWTALESLPNCLGVWPAYHPSAADFVTRLVDWANELPETRQAALLLFDGLDLMNGSDFTFQHALRWLLMYGPERQIWPVISANPARLSHLHAWLDYFRTRVIGKVQHPYNVRSLVGDPQTGLELLLPGKEFLLVQSGRKLKFWLPPLE